MDISLSELLTSRDNRKKKQADLINFYHHPVISLTLVMPGSEKRNNLTKTLSPKAVSIIDNSFGDSIITKAEYDLVTGFEAYFVISLDKMAAKRKACLIEDNHPLGRLLDIDIIGLDYLPVSRKDLGFEPRKCLLCREDAHFCMRNQTHSTQEILEKISSILSKTVF